MSSVQPVRLLARQLREPEHFHLLAGFCHQCQAQLPLFISDELAGQPVGELYPDIAYHLDLCPVCLPEYEALARLTAAALYSEENE